VYLPCHSLGSYVTIQSLHTEISDIISAYPGYTLVFDGDMNNNLTENSISTIYIKKFMYEFNLALCNDLIVPNCSYTYHHDSLQNASIVDYFL